MQVLAFKNISKSMKSFSILMVKSCGLYKYTYYIHVSVAISACCHKPKTHPHPKKGGGVVDVHMPCMCYSHVLGPMEVHGH